MTAEVATKAWKRRGLTMAVAAIATALLIAPSASAAGDPVASGQLSLNVTKGFKKALKRNGVRMKGRKFKIRPAMSKIDPVNGTGRVNLRGKLRFIGHGKRVVARKLVAKIGGSKSSRGGNLKGTVKGRKLLLLRLRAKPQGAIVTRTGFGARISRIAARLSNPFAKMVNRKLGLHSLVPSRRIARLSVREQPKTVEVTGGSVFVDIPAGYLPTSPLGTNEDPNTVAAKSPAHCIGPSGGVAAIEPGELASLTSPNPDVGPLPTGVAARFKFPVTGGTVGPAGDDGVVQVAGGVRLQTGTSGIDSGLFPQPSDCAGEAQGPTTSHSYLDTTNLAPNLDLHNLLANTFIGGTTPGCNFTTPPAGCGVFAGDKGPAIGQVIDTTSMTVSADPNAKTVSIAGALIRNNSTATLVLNGLFPNAGSPSDQFADGDKFGVSSITVSTR